MDDSPVPRDRSKNHPSRNPRACAMTRPGATTRSTGASARDTMVTGMGFCLPGENRPVFTAADVWDVASHGRTCLKHDGVYYGAVNLSPTMFNDRLPESPSYSPATTPTPTGSDWCPSWRPGRRPTGHPGRRPERGGPPRRPRRSRHQRRSLPRRSASSPARRRHRLDGAGDCSSPPHQALTPAGRRGRPGGAAPHHRPLLHGVLRLRVRRRADRQRPPLIADRRDRDRRRDRRRRLRPSVIQQRPAGCCGRPARHEAMGAAGMPDLLASFDRLMRPYDRRADCINHGEGSATVILESREHAQRRGAHLYGQVLATAMTRDGLDNPLATDAAAPSSSGPSAPASATGGASSRSRTSTAPATAARPSPPWRPTPSGSCTDRTAPSC